MDYHNFKDGTPETKIFLENEFKKLTNEIDEGKTFFAKMYKQQKNKTINILDFEIDEVFIPTIYIDNENDRQIMNDAFQEIDVAVTMEKTNINIVQTNFGKDIALQYMQPVCMNNQNTHVLKLYEIGNKIECINRDKYLLEINNKATTITMLLQQLQTNYDEISKITKVNNNFESQLYSNFYKINFTIPSVFDTSYSLLETEIKTTENGTYENVYKPTENSTYENVYKPTGNITYENFYKQLLNTANAKIKSQEIFNVLPYNNIDNKTNLMPFKFNDNGTPILDTIFSSQNKTNDTIFYIYVNTHTFSTFISTQCKYIKVFDNHLEYGFQLLIFYKTNNNDVIEFIKTMFNKKSFKSKDEIEKKLLILEKYIKLCDETNEPSSENSEYTIVKNYINHLFEIIANNSDYKIKASDIFEIFEKKQYYLGLTVDNNFRNRLSKYLIQIGLQKKRFSDGYYYYGLKQRT